jgi:sulfatase maturation enzyme AslB (radical SAM superfamily)
MSSSLRAGPETFENTRRVQRIRYRLRLYARIVLGSIGRVPLKELVRTQFPFWMEDAATVPSLGVELTNHCNLRCGYCTNPTTLRPRGLMSEATFARLICELKKGGVYRVALCGNGESTLHPRFVEYVGKLSRAAPYVSLTSNWQRVGDEIMLAALRAVQEINVSVDEASSAVYEARRIGGNFSRLTRNLERLLALKQSIRSRALVNVRVMLGTSDLPLEEEILKFWRPYADVVSKQYILELGADTSRAFRPISEGRCTLPLKKLDLHWNGIVNLCGYSWMQTGDPEGIVLGNIAHATLLEMWNGDLIRQYREGHRRRIEAMTPICRGCPGRT